MGSPIRNRTQVAMIPTVSSRIEAAERQDNTKPSEATSTYSLNSLQNDRALLFPNLLNYHPALSWLEISEEELKAFPQFKDNPTRYLLLRNYFLLQWWQTVQQATQSSDSVPRTTYSEKSLSEEIYAIHKWLSDHYYIQSFLSPPLSIPRQTIGNTTTETLPYNDERNKVSVVIIGAGVAGLAAAQHLYKNGFRNLTILEARNRIGGRIHSQTIRSCIVDLGASFIHGTKGNPIVSVCKEICAQLYATDEDCILYDYTGERIPEKIDIEIEQQFNEILDKTDALRKPFITKNVNVESKVDCTNWSLGQAIDFVMKEMKSKQKDENVTVKKENSSNEITTEEEAELLTHFVQLVNDRNKELQSQKNDNTAQSLHANDETQDTSTQSCSCNNDTCCCQCNCSHKSMSIEGNTISQNALTERVLNWHFANIEGPCAADISRLSLLYWDQDDPYEYEGSHCILPDGYCQVTRYLAQDLNIRLKCKVTEISTVPCTANDPNSSYRSVVRYVTLDTNKEETIEADHVIVTIPLGLLKAKAIKFSPPLPASKEESIERLGYGLVNKVFLHFPFVFWDRKKDYIGITGVIRGLYYLTLSLYKATKCPVLMVYIAGDIAYKVEQWKDETIVEDILQAFRKIYGPEVPLPLNYAVTRWYSDEYSRGSYSFVAIGANGDDYNQLAEPLHNNALLFAGEHTSQRHPATVAGAYLSGIREAKRIIRHFCNKNNTNPSIKTMDFESETSTPSTDNRKSRLMTRKRQHSEVEKNEIFRSRVGQKMPKRRHLTEIIIAPPSSSSSTSTTAPPSTNISAFTNTTPKTATTVTSMTPTIALKKPFSTLSSPLIVSSQLESEGKTRSPNVSSTRQNDNVNISSYRQQSQTSHAHLSEVVNPSASVNTFPQARSIPFNVVPMKPPLAPFLKPPLSFQPNSSRPLPIKIPSIDFLQPSPLINPHPATTNVNSTSRPPLFEKNTVNNNNAPTGNRNDTQNLNAQPPAVSQASVAIGVPPIQGKPNDKTN